MDAIDRKILGVLQQDASLSVAEVGKRQAAALKKVGLMDANA